jgi:predicted aldo/keto reductase-like oxidoreductase
MKRRTFLKTVGGVAGGLALGYRPLFADPDDPARRLWPDPSGLPRRELGRTGQKISIVGFPGLSLTHESQETSTAALRRAFESGVNYFDVAPAYGNGDAEIKMGIGLAAGVDRSKIFLSCKTTGRSAERARRDLETSLQRLKTDHFDLYQMHSMSSLREVQEVLAPGGALEAFLKARDEGKVKWLGFSAHSPEAALALLQGYRFDTVMYPVNFIEHFIGDFSQQVLAAAQERGAGVIAIKPMAGGSWPRGMERTRPIWYRPLEDPQLIDLALRFSLSRTPVVTGLPPSFVALFEKAVASAKQYRPATDAELAELKTAAAKFIPIFAKNGRGAAAIPHPDNPHHPQGVAYA